MLELLKCPQGERCSEGDTATGDICFVSDCGNTIFSGSYKCVSVKSSSLMCCGRIDGG